MTPLNMLYLGPEGGTCLDRANALRRLGHHVTHLDLRQMLPRTRWVDRITWRAGGEVFTPWVIRGLAFALGSQQFDLCHVDNGEWVSARVMNSLRQYANRVINYNIDDPFGPRDGRRFSAYRQALALYDLVAVVREENVAEAQALGARAVLRVWRSADEVSHRPRELTPQDHARWDCDVLFLGTWMPERGPFLLGLAERGVPLTIQGDNWHKAPEWPRLQPFWRGGGIHGDDYAKAIQCAKVNLGLVSKGNRDLHTTRSLEIPALGALLCAERTAEHLQMYLEGREAVFWSGPDECADRCKQLLVDTNACATIAAHGQARLRSNGHLNEQVLNTLLRRAVLHPADPVVV